MQLPLLKVTFQFRLISIPLTSPEDHKFYNIQKTNYPCLTWFNIYFCNFPLLLTPKPHAAGKLHSWHGHLSVQGRLGSSWLLPCYIKACTSASSKPVLLSPIQRQATSSHSVDWKLPAVFPFPPFSKDRTENVKKPSCAKLIELILNTTPKTQNRKVCPMETSLP